MLAEGERMTVHIHHADAVQWAREYDGDKFHALLCDPPYELGFMGKKWDASGVPFSPATWAAFANVLHDGAFIMAFASSRGWHRQAVAMEDAGLIIHPSIFGWAFGSGFPKATRIDTQIDKAAGAEREVVGKTVVPKQFMREVQSEMGYRPTGNPYQGEIDGRYNAPVTAPATPLARAFAGHRYGLQALKPALEPIIVAQKPYKGKPVECIVRTGAGALWVDGGRIGTQDEYTQAQWSQKCASRPTGVVYGTHKPSDSELPAGRWPANFYCDEAGAVALDAQSGERKGAVSNSAPNTDVGFTRGAKGLPLKEGYGDTGGASRFFFQSTADQIDDADAVGYYAKASRRERDAGLDGMPAQTVYSGDLGGRDAKQPGRRHDPNGEWDEVSSRMMARAARNTHPTIKPISLTRWLATLLLPPAEYAPRRLFVPFAGAGSECIGAALAGWDEVVGVEMMNDEEHPYVDIARARLDYWLMKRIYEN
jgi:hypothetical protein